MLPDVFVCERYRSCSCICALGVSMLVMYLCASSIHVGHLFVCRGIHFGHVFVC
jgi:hypothetical protein